jgi:hypothetical protein
MAGLTEKERLLLEILKSTISGHIADEYLKKRLAEQGVEERDYKIMKRKLLFKGYIGKVYGNIILEKNEF